MSGESDSIGTKDDLGIEREALSVVEERPGPAVSTRTVAEALAVDEVTAEQALERLAARDELTKVDLEGEYVAWERESETFVGRLDGDSYTLRDARTGIVTRGESRTGALRRLADRIDAFEDGEHVGAQILGISDAAISPTYLSGVDDVYDSFVRPDYATLYVYVAGEGVREIETETQLNRSQRIKGFCTTAVLDAETFDEVMVTSTEDVIDRTDLDHEHFPVGVFKVLAVPPEYQQQGIGTALATQGMAYLAETPPVLAMLWKRDDQSNERIADNFGFDRLADFEHTTPLSGKCPQCGFDDDCTCNSVLYGWGLDVAT